MDGKLFQVVINHQEQYSIAPAGQTPERGWRAVGRPATKEHCFDYIEDVWTDMRSTDRRRLHDLVRRL